MLIHYVGAACGEYGMKAHMMDPLEWPLRRAITMLSAIGGLSSPFHRHHGSSYVSHRVRGWKAGSSRFW